MKNTKVKPQKPAQIDVKTTSPKEKAKLNPKSRKYAINAMCCECIYDNSDIGTWRQQIAACPSTGCPLYQLRPKPIAADNLLKQSKLEDFA